MEFLKKINFLLKYSNSDLSDYGEMAGRVSSNDLHPIFLAEE